MNKAQAMRAIKLYVAGQLLSGSRPVTDDLSVDDEARLDRAAEEFGLRIMREIGHYAQVPGTVEEAVRMALEQVR